MKLRRVAIENVRSFLERQELLVPGDMCIIGPNGGGKTNLLDAAVVALRLYLLKSWVPRHNPTPDWEDRFEWVPNDAITPGLLDKHTAGLALSQTIELDLEVTKTDVENILRTKAEAPDLQANAMKRYTSFPGSNAASWVTEGLQGGEVFTYRIANRSLQDPELPLATTFLRYLETYEIRVREEHEKTSLSMPMISLPVNRSAADVSASISLASFNEYDSKRMVDAASSRNRLARPLIVGPILPV